MSENPTYQQQWERTIRWYGRFKEISERRDISQSTTSDEDDVYAFFVNCYHLKDWIKNDSSAGQMRDNVETFITKSEALSICADLCNALKHLSLDKSRSGQDPRFGNKTSRVFLQSTPIIVCRGYTIVTDRKTFDAFELAGQCLMDWWTFISENQARITKGPT